MLSESASANFLWAARSPCMQAKASITVAGRLFTIEEESAHPEPTSLRLL